MLDHNIGTRSAYARLLALKLGAFDDNACTHAVAWTLRAHFNFADGHDTGQSLASKAHGMERKQVVGTSDLGSRMAFESHTCIYRRHSAAIVHHLYQRLSGVLDNYLHISGAGIYSVLYKLLNHRSRTLDYFAGGDLIGHGIGQGFNNIFVHKHTKVAFFFDFPAEKSYLCPSEN